MKTVIFIFLAFMLPTLANSADTSVSCSYDKNPKMDIYNDPEVYKDAIPQPVIFIIGSFEQLNYSNDKLNWRIQGPSKMYYRINSGEIFKIEKGVFGFPWSISINRYNGKAEFYRRLPATENSALTEIKVKGSCTLLPKPNYLF